MPDFDSYWGKATPPDLEGPGYHPFACHSLDVVVVGKRWLEMSHALARSLLGNEQPDVMRAWVLFFLGLHDFGKLDSRFQAKALDAVACLAPERAELVAKLAAGAGKYDHGSEGFRWALSELSCFVGVDAEDEDVSAIYRDAWLPWLAAVTGHHGALPKDTQPPNAVMLPPPLRRADRAARLQWVQALEAAFLIPAGLSLKDLPPPMPALLAGFCSVADWLGSNTDAFPYVQQLGDLAAYLAERSERATDILRSSGLISRPASVGGMTALFPERTPRQVQTVVDALPRVPGLTLVEAPTGSGKTEAALAYAAHLLAEGLADSIVFALPTQATANAMLGRLEKIASRLFPGANANVVLAHGKAGYNPDFIALQQAARPVTAQSTEEALVQCAEWLSQSRKRAFLGQIGVCTIDQVLLGVLPVRHNFVRTLGVGRSVLIVDEVHAYDSYMYGLLEEVLRRQRQAGGSVVLLSATLPYDQRRRLVQAWASDAEIDQRPPYPLLTHVDAAGVVTTLEPGQDQQPSPRSVSIELVVAPAAFPDEALCQRILDAARTGARVAVICNLVDHAQALARLLRGMAGDVPVDLFHARFRFCDRQARERAVMSTYGASSASGAGRVLVATQVVEQSLDLDFDWLITQLCPVDLLFQRLGRLHRHERPRLSGFEQPRALVLLPEESDFALHSVIYGNVRVLWRTRQRLEPSQRIDFPEAYRSWIESVYDPDDWPDEPAEILAAADAWWARQRSARQEALQLAGEGVTVWADEESRVQFLTRDGEMSLTVLPITQTRTLLDGRGLDSLAEWERAEVLNQQSVSVPAGWCSFLPPAEDGVHYLPMRFEAGSWVAELDKVRLIYSQEYGMEKQAS